MTNHQSGKTNLDNDKRSSASHSPVPLERASAILRPSWVPPVKADFAGFSNGTIILQGGAK